jgi:hypothetical protein
LTIRVARSAEFGVNVTVYSGKITREELMAHYQAISAEDAACANRWISYFAPTADLSDIDIAAFAELRRVTNIKLHEVYGDRRLAVAIVCDSRVNEPILSVWRSYIVRDREHPADPGLFSSLKAACDWLELSDAGREEVLKMIGHDRAGDGGAQEAVRTVERR